jgi:hypothetical protein
LPQGSRVTVALTPRSLVRELQALTATSRLEATAAAGGHAVVAGDFSASPDTNAIRFRRGLGSLEGRSIAYRTPGRPSSATTTDSPSARTTLVSGGNWPLKLGRRIDYILVRCDENGPPCAYATGVASSTSHRRRLGQRSFRTHRQPRPHQRRRAPRKLTHLTSRPPRGAPQGERRNWRAGAPSRSEDLSLVLRQLILLSEACRVRDEGNGPLESSRIRWL